MAAGSATQSGIRSNELTCYQIKPGMERWWINAPVDEYGFVYHPRNRRRISGRQTRVTIFAALQNHLTAGGEREVEKLRARIKTQSCTDCSAHALRYMGRIKTETTDVPKTYLFFCFSSRENRTSLSAEENAEEAHLRARVDSYEHGPERAAQRSLYALNDKERIARQSGPRLTRKERIDLRFLRVLYSRLPPPS